MRAVLLMLAVMYMYTVSGQNLIRGTIRPGGASNQVEVWLQPNFSNSTEYLAQILMPIAFPASISPYPTLTAANVTLAPEFVSAFGSNYGVQVYAMANNTGNSEKYFTIALVRGGAGASNPQTWTSGSAFKVLTATFLSSSASTQIKLADYQDAGSNGQGNFYAADGNSNYYYDFGDSRNNFYGIPGFSTAGGVVAAGFARTDALVTLPVSIINFSGYKSGSKNVLKWTTANEQNNRGFEVQRSADGVSYSAIGFVNSVAPGGNSSTELTYSYDDNSPLVAKKSYYRLRQVDIDNRSKLSNVVLINGDKPKVAGIGGIFPNPASQLINVIVESPQREDVTLVLMDVSGKTIKQKLVNVEMGSNTIPLQIGELAAGSYLVKVLSRSAEGGESTASKFVKQ